jgi:hypothetical protein
MNVALGRAREDDDLALAAGKRKYRTDALEPPWVRRAERVIEH